MKLDEARENLIFNPEKVNDGINYAQWREWDGEIITLQRKDTRWVWKQLQRLTEAENDLDKARALAEKYRDLWCSLTATHNSKDVTGLIEASKLPWEKV
jgi:hypothetical protein